MAKELDAFPQTRGRIRGESKYPYDQWFNGKVWQLDAGEDFDVKMSSFRSTIIAAAKDRGVKVRTAAVNDGKSLVVQKTGLLK